MTLEELNLIQKESSSCRSAAERAKSLASRLAAIRTSDEPLMVAYKNLGNWNEDVKSAIEGIINECGHDLLRIVEMRQEAFARLKSEQARQKLAAIDAALGEQP